MIDTSKLKELRKNKGVTTKELAEKLCVSQPMISYIENGDKKPSIDLFIRIANYFGVTLDELVRKE